MKRPSPADSAPLIYRLYAQRYSSWAHLLSQPGKHFMKIESNTGSPTVLIVDDEADLREALKMQFELSGVRALCAANGNEALDLLKKGDQSKVAVILSDVLMPNGDGLHLLKGMRENNINIPIIFMTGFENLITESADKLGFSAKISKPFDWEQLYSVICRFIDCPKLTVAS